MTWARLDDRLHADPRLAVAGLEAFGLYCAALSWMGAFLTDGEITVAQVKRLAGRRGLTLATRLVTAGFWIEISPDKWGVFEWKNHLLSREEVERERARKSELGRAGARAIHAKRQETPPAVRQPDGTAASDGSRARDPDPVPIPSRSNKEEDPPVSPPAGDTTPAGESLKPEPTGEAPKKRRRPETPIPDGWGPSEEHFKLGRTLGFDAQRVRREGDRFADGARAKDRRYVDWHAAFANWLRNERGYAEQRGERLAPIVIAPETPKPRSTFVYRPRFPGLFDKPVEPPKPPPEPEDDEPELTPEARAELLAKRRATLAEIDAEEAARG